MAKQVVGLFDTAQDAQGAVQGLRDAGFNADDISVVVNNSSGEYATTDGAGSEAAEGAGAGATGGAILGGLGGLLVGLGALAIPGIGPVVAAGTLATALGSTAIGAGIGAAAGGLVGALVGAGIPENDANVYAEGIRRGGALVTVRADSDDDADRAADILDRYNVVDIDERASDYRSSGWNRFDENADPYATRRVYSGAYTDESTAPGYGTDVRGDVDTTDSEWSKSSKAGTAGGAVAGGAAGAAIGSVAGPVGTAVGAAAGAVTGAGVGAAGDAAGEAAKERREGDDYASTSRTVDTTTGNPAAMGSATDYTKTSSTTGYTTADQSTVGTTTDSTRRDYQTGTRDISADQGEVAIPVVEEDIRVGKREVEGGGVRVTTNVEETPVNEQVSLHEEHVTVDRRPVDRPVDAGTVSDAFRERTFEVRERSEEAVVQKDARVVEEVVINKDTNERTENIQDTVRRTNVDVEQLEGTSRASGYTDASAVDTSRGDVTRSNVSSTDTSRRTDAPQSEWSESSKVGTAGGAVAGGAAGAAIGSVAGPVGTAVGGIAGAVTGAGIGAAGDAAGEAAKDASQGEDDYPASSSANVAGATSSTRYEDISRTVSDDTSDTTSNRDEGPIERGLGNLEAGAERTTGRDINRSGGVGDRDTRDNY